jgi:hypothetical protein
MKFKPAGIAADAGNAVVAPRGLKWVQGLWHKQQQRKQARAITDRRCWTCSVQGAASCHEIAERHCSSALLTGGVMQDDVNMSHWWAGEW